MKALLVLVLLAGVAEAGSHCHETSPILGRRRCSGFGSGWAHDSWLGLFVYEFALAYEDVAVPGADARGTVYSATQSAGYQLGLAPGTTHHMHALGPRMRFGYRAPNTTFAFEVTGAFAVASPTTVTTVDGFSPRSTSGGSMLDMAGLVGYHRRRGTLQLGGELAIGLRTTLLEATLPPGFTACMGGATGKGCYVSASDAQLLVEPRARADWWLTPDLTVGASAGIDVAARGASLSLILAWHLAAYDGS